MSEDAKSFAASETEERTPEADRLNDEELDQVSGGDLTAAFFCNACGVRLYTTDELFFAHKPHGIVARLIDQQPQGILKKLIKI
jgi:bacteriocin-like protein